MNKKLKKALYMFDFALPIVAIPIITVACGTQTSQNSPKEGDKNQNKETPKQEIPIQDENKKVTVLPSLSSSKIYDEDLLNDNVIELFKLFEEKPKFENIKKTINEILKKLKEGLNSSSDLNTLNQQIDKLDEILKNTENSKNLNIITNSINEILAKAKKIAKKANETQEEEDETQEVIKLRDKYFSEIGEYAINFYKKIFSIESN